MQADAHAVERHRRLVAQAGVDPAALGAVGERAREGQLDVLARAHEDLAVVAVERDPIARARSGSSRRAPGRPSGCRARARRSSHARSASPPPGSRRAAGRDRSRSARPGPSERATRTNSSGRLRRVVQLAAPGQMDQQPVGERIEIVQALLEIGVGDLRPCAAGSPPAPGAPPPRRSARCGSPRACCAASRRRGRTCGRPRAPRGARHWRSRAAAAARRPRRAGSRSPARGAPPRCPDRRRPAGSPRCAAGAGPRCRAPRPRPGAAPRAARAGRCGRDRRETLPGRSGRPRRTSRRTPSR